MDIDTEALRQLATAHRAQPGGLLPALHAIQDRWGHVPPQGVPVIAEVFNLSRAEVHGVVTYYHHFRSAPPGRHVVQLCRAEACQAMGAEDLVAHAERQAGCALHATSADGRLTLEPVYCLGLCASSPAIAIDGEPHARITPQRYDALIGALVDAAVPAPALAEAP
ncbi:formate dehydrogenase subunit gamma [Piscinibacter sakaiensis]|uniref:NAD-dependent formate dehydrogenase, gamma subunit n=1 Tax=Piscinibacter sakaiensis TaxID=1547922 RepID=A0A0K8P4A7_PISS1|nr:formate dehydrogenase subunit gamma [Piscinibacter sakaiensis]GAP37431.1 NAD-dependent formate dehydrogenase, gamma subunit [Piscinibacter sakaiensis]